MSTAPNTPRKKTMLDDWRQPHPATAEPLPGGKYPAAGVWQQKNNGQIVFKINDGVYEQGNKSNHKEVDMNYVDRGAIFEAVLDAASDPNFGTKQIPIQKKAWIKAGGQSKLSDNPIIQAIFTVTRNKEGQILLGYSKGDYKAQLLFKGANFTTVLMRNAEGNKVEDVGLMSRWVARNWVNFHRNLLDEMERNAWEAPQPKNNGGGNGGYGGGNGGNGGGNSYGGGGGGHSTMDDDDLDF